MIAFGVELLALDAFARGKTRALALVPLAHLLWVNSHQLWPLSLVIQAMFVADLAWQRDGRRARLAALALAASVLLTFATPLGFRIVLAPLRTAQSLAIFREHVDEFHRIWTMSHELDAGAGDRRARRVGAVAHAPRDAAVRGRAVAAVAGAGRVGGARADVLRRRQRRRVPALRAARERGGRDAAAAAQRDHAPRSRRRSA